MLVPSSLRLPAPVNLGVRLSANQHLAIRSTLLNMSAVALFFICTGLAIALALWPLKRSMFVVGTAFLLTYCWLLSNFLTEVNQPDNDSPGVILAMFVMLVPGLLVAILGGLRITYALLFYAFLQFRKNSRQD